MRLFKNTLSKASFCLYMYTCMKLTLVFSSFLKITLGEASKLLLAGCNENAAAFHCYVKLFLYNLIAASC